MGACINTEEVRVPQMKRTASKKTSIEDSVHMTNSIKKLRQY